MLTEILPPLHRPLVNAFYKSHASPMRARGHHQIWVLRDPDICAALCLQPVADGLWLTNLLTAPARRGEGLASTLLASVRQRYQGPVWLFCAPRLQGFYAACGFSRAEHLPAPLQQRLQRYQQHKPLCAMMCTSS